jgi:hypothetical protein
MCPIHYDALRFIDTKNNLSSIFTNLTWLKTANCAFGNVLAEQPMLCKVLLMKKKVDFMFMSFGCVYKLLVQIFHVFAHFLQVIGMVTRKDLARFREGHENGKLVINELFTSN